MVTSPRYVWAYGSQPEPALHALAAVTKDVVRCPARQRQGLFDLLVTGCLHCKDMG